MEEKKSIPVSLTVVAILFIVAGVSVAIEMVVSLMHGHLNLNLGVLGIFIGLGLLRLSRGWRTCALVFIWIALIGTPIIALVFIIVRGPLDFSIFGQVVGHTTKELGLLMAGILFAVSLWQYHVLTRPDVKKLFRI